MATTILRLVFPVTALSQSSWGVAVDKDRTLYFCDIQRDRVWRYTAETLHSLMDHNHCHTLVLGYDGNIYGENVGGESREGGVRGIWQLTPQGERTFLLPLTADPDPSVWLVRDSAGNTYSWNGEPDAKSLSQILKRAPDGKTEVLAGSHWGFADGPGQHARLGQVAGMAAQADGTLYVADDGNLRRVAPDGAVMTLARGIVSSSGGGLPHVGGLYNHHLGVATNPYGTVYVVDYGMRHILRWDPAGGAQVVYESGGIANWLTRGSWGWRPTGVAVAGDSVYVMEYWGLPTFAAGLIGNPRVRKISPGASITTVVAIYNPSARMVTGAVVALIIGLFAWRRVSKKLSAVRHSGQK